MDKNLIKSSQFNYFEIDHLRETVKGADVEHIQLSSGQFSGKNIQFDLPNTIICAGTYTQKLLAQGTLPEEMLTFGLVLNQVHAGTLLGQRFGQGDLIFLPEKAELHYLLPAHTIWVGFNIPRNLLEQKVGEFTLNKPSIIRSLSQDYFTINSIIRQLYSNELNLDSEQVEEQLIECISNIITDEVAGQNKIELKLPKQSIILKKTDSYLHEHIDSQVKVSDLIKELDCSHRTVNYVFRENLNMSLKQYIQQTKLNQLRDMLLNEVDEQKTIKEIAISCGLSHMGRVSENYRKIFGEYPSQTRNF